MRENDAIFDRSITETKSNFCTQFGSRQAQVFAATYRGADSELPLQSSELYSPMPAQRENFADFGRCEQFPTKMKVRAVDPRCLEKTIFRVFLR